MTLGGGRGRGAVSARCLIASATMHPTHTGRPTYFTSRMSPLCVEHAHSSAERETCRISGGGWSSQDGFLPADLFLRHIGSVHCCVRISAYEIKCCQHIAVTTPRTWSTGFQCKAPFPTLEGRVYLELMARQLGNCKEVAWMDGWPSGVMICKAQLPNFWKLTAHFRWLTPM